MAKNSDKYFPEKKKGDVVDGARNLLKAPLDGLALFCLATLKAIIRFFCLTSQEEIRRILTKFAITD